MNILAAAALILGAVFCLLSYLTWGFNNHMIGFPYKAFAAAGVALVLLGIWMLKR